MDQLPEGQEGGEVVLDRMGFGPPKLAVTDCEGHNLLELYQQPGMALGGIYDEKMHG